MNANKIQLEAWGSHKSAWLEYSPWEKYGKRRVYVVVKYIDKLGRMNRLEVGYHDLETGIDIINKVAPQAIQAFKDNLSKILEAM